MITPRIGKANALNQLSLVLDALWCTDETELVEFLERDPISRDKPFDRAQLIRNLCRTDVALVMRQLSFSYLINPREGVESFSQLGLAELIFQNSDSKRGTLRDIILPALSQSGFIEPFEKRKKGSTNAHVIKITTKGIHFMLSYYGRVEQKVKPLIQELGDLYERETETSL